MIKYCNFLYQKYHSFGETLIFKIENVLFCNKKTIKENINLRIHRNAIKINTKILK